MSQSLGTLLARLGADTTQFDAALTRSQMRMKAVGKSMKRVGMQMSMALTLPLALIGAASFKMAKDFETSLSKVIGLVGVAREQVNVWKDEILAMAPAVGKMPKELGEALFFVTSAGIRGAEAMEVLKASAQAASAGLGETKSVADLVTSAMNAYGSETLNAVQATDVLVAAVREGKAEASELAESMGMVLPLASEMGVKFHAIGAAVAAMTRTGTNAATASMQLRQILASLLKPTKESSDLLKELGTSHVAVEKGFKAMGTSASYFRKVIRERGLFQALEEIKELSAEFGEEAMSTVFPNIRALSGVLDIMGANMEDNRGIFERMVDSTGSLSKAFEAAAKTTEFKWNAAMSRGGAALIKLGDVVKEIVMPIITGFSKIIEGLGKWFDGLSDSGKKIVVVIGGLVAALGPLLIILGFLMTSVIPGLVTAFGVLNAVILANPIAALITVLALVTTAIITFGRETKKTAKFHSEYYSMLAKEKTELDLLFSSLNNVSIGTRERKTALDQVNKVYGKYLPELLTEKSNTEDLAKAYALINEALVQNIALKAKQADIAKIINKSIALQKTLVADVTIEGGTEGGLALSRMYDNIAKLKKEEIAVPITMDIDYSDAIEVFERLRTAGAKIEFPAPDEMLATVKVLIAQNQQQEELNDTNLFYDEILKSIGATLRKVNEETTAAQTTAAQTASEKLLQEEKIQRQIYALREKYGLVGSIELMNREIAELNNLYPERLINEENFLKANEAIREKYKLIGNVELMEKEIVELNKGYAEKLKNEETYQILLKAIKDKYAQDYKIDRGDFAMVDEEVFDDGLDSMQILKDNWVNLTQEMRDKLRHIWKGVGSDITKQMDNISATLNAGLESLVVTFAEGIGDLMTGDANIGDFGKNLLRALGQFLKQMGSALIVFGVIMEAFRDWAVEHPIAAIALGIAAIAAGQALMSLANKGPDIQGLATGGVVTSGGVFEVGERGKETVYLPTGSAVTPHKAGGDQELFGIIRGEDIYMSNKRYTDKLGRVT